MSDDDDDLIWLALLIPDSREGWVAWLVFGSFFLFVAHHHHWLGL